MIWLLHLSFLASVDSSAAIANMASAVMSAISILGKTITWN